MTLTQLEYFCAVCRYHSITRASDVLFVTQPTISTAIKKLEEEFHTELFQHGANRIKLTLEGERFYLKAEALLSKSRDIYGLFPEIGNEGSPVRVGIPPMMSTIFFPDMLYAFHREFDIPVRLYEYGSVRACQLVSSGGLDAAIVNMDYYDIDHFENFVMLESSYSYCVSRAHSFAGLKKISLDMLRDESMILFNTDSVQNRTIMTSFQSLGIKPHIIMHSSQLFTILNFVRNGDVGAFIFSAVKIDEDEFSSIPLSPDIDARFGMVWRKGITLSQPVRNLINFARRYRR